MDPSRPEHSRVSAEETELSRRYLGVIQDWIPTGLRYFADWPDRPGCGHFLGGCHWYGIETVSGALAFAAAASSPEYDAARGGAPREELADKAWKALRYLCFTHDTGPADCVRPAHGLGRPENFGNKWGERGLGFFRESQCGGTIAGMALVARLLGERVDAETQGMLEAIHLDYAERFAGMSPQNGVYLDTQMEENAWTSFGLLSVALVLSSSPRAKEYQAAAERWMFLTATVPQDAKNQLAFAGGESVARRTGKTFTALPDYMAENHGMVHPSYTCSSVSYLSHIALLCRLWGREIPPQALFNRDRIYHELKPMTDSSGYLHPVQGMDWPYHFPDPASAVHATASVLFGDADAAALERRALHYLERRCRSNGGRMYSEEIGATCHDIQDPLIIRESAIASPVYTYLFHRLLGDGPRPTPAGSLERRLRGVRAYAHSGFVFQRHARGHTSFSWRNCVMVLPVTRDGLLMVAPASGSCLAQIEVRGRPDSQEEISLRYELGTERFVAALVMDRAQGALRQEVLCAGLPNGMTAVYERLSAVEDLVIERLDQGFLRITNETLPELGENCRGSRVISTPQGSETFKGFPSPEPSSDVERRYDHPAWLNVDGRLGIVFAGSGETAYRNRHYFKPWWAVADDLTLSRATPGAVKQGKVAAWLAALYAPESSARKTAELASSGLRLLKAPIGCAGMIADGMLVAARFTPREGMAAFRLARSGPEAEPVPVFPGETVVSPAEVRYEIALGPGQALLRAPLALAEVDGAVRFTASEAGGLVVENTGRKPASVRLKGARKPLNLRPASCARLL